MTPKALIGFFAFVILLSSAASAYEIIDDSVFYDSQYANLTVTPHTVIDPERNHQEFNVCAKASPGALCVAYVFDSPLQSGTAEYWTAYDHPYTYCYTETDCETQYSNYEDWLQVNSAFSTTSYQGKQIYYTTSPLDFHAHECQTWRIRYKPQEDEGKWNLWTWNSQTGDCAADYIGGNYNFFYDLDPWWSTSDSNVTEGYVYLSNHTAADTLEDYDYVLIDNMDHTTSWTINNDATLLATSTNRIEDTNSIYFLMDISNHGAVNGKLEKQTFNGIDISSTDTFSFWLFIENISEVYLAADTNCYIFIDDQLNINTYWYCDPYLSSITTGWNKVNLKYDDVSGGGATDLTDLDQVSIIIGNINSGDFDVRVDHIHAYNSSNYFNTSRWIGSNQAELQKRDNDYSHNSTTIRGMTSGYPVHFINESFTNSVEYIARVQPTAALKWVGILLANETTKTDIFDTTGYWVMIRNAAAADTYVKRTVDGVAVFDEFTDEDIFPEDKWFWLRLLYNNTNSNLSAYYSLNGTTWTFLNSFINSDYDQMYAGIMTHDIESLVDNILIREIIPNTIYSPQNITPSFIYDDSEENPWTDAVIEWQRSDNKDLPSYTTIHTDTYPNPSDQTDFTRELSGGIWRANVSVCDASACVSNYTQTITIYNSSKTITADDAVSSAVIQSFSAYNNQTGETFSTTTSDLILYLIDQTQVEYSSTSYENKNQSSTEDTVTLNPLVTFLLLMESDNTAFNISKTTSTTMTIYCPEKTIEHTFTSSSASLAIDCPWSFMKLDVTYNTSSYFRTLIPSLASRSINFYLIEANTETTLQIIMRLIDMTGEYSDGILHIRKFINSSTKDLIDQEFDIESKATTYLILNNLYTVAITNNLGSERNLGNFLADAAGEKTLILPEIEYVPDTYIGDTISTEWNLTNDSLKLHYQDSSGLTEWLTFTVKNASNTSQVFYSTTSYNVTDVTFTYVPAQNISYLVSYEGSHPDIDDLADNRIYSLDIDLNSDIESSTKTLMTIVIIIALLCLMGKESAPAALGLSSVILIIAKKVQWFTFGSTRTDTAVIGIFCLLAGLSFWIKGYKK